MIYLKDVKFKQYKSLICDILSTILDWTNIHLPSLYLDMNQCTDIVSKQGKAAVRIRNGNYPYRDLTIRNRLTNCNSLIEKILNSPISYYLLMYLINNSITLIYVIDINLMRKQNLFKTMLNNYQSNGDYTGFYYISLSILKAKNCIVWQYVNGKC